MRTILVTSLVLVSGACATTHGPAPAPRPAVEPAAAVDWSRASCARHGTFAVALRVADAREGSAVALVRAGQGPLTAYVADADSLSVHTVSVDDRRELVRTRVDGAPRQLVVLTDGRLVATIADAAHIEVLEPAADPSAPLVKLCEREVPVEPWGLALSPADTDLVVTSGWGGALTVLDAATMTVKRVVALPRDPRAVVIDRSNVAFVSHLVGAKMSAVDLGTSATPETIELGVHKSTPKAQLEDMVALRTGAQGYALAKVTLPTKSADAMGAERILAPMVSVDPGEAVRERAIYYGPPFDGVPKETPFVSVVDPEKKQPLGRYLLGTGEGHFARECLLPRAATVRRSTSSLLVTCFGIDALLELDALAVDPFRAERRRLAVPPGPDGVAVDDASGRAVVFSQMAGSLSVISLDDLHDRKAAPATIALDYRPSPKLARVAKGRQLFYRTDDVRIAIDGLACSSCHMDGRDDSITWATPSGPRQTPMLAGRMAGTAPYGWEGERQNLHDYISNTVTNLGGKGVTVEETAALSGFLLSLKGPPAGRRGGSGNLGDLAGLVERGQELFTSAEQGCSACHSGEASTDTTVHDMEGRKAPIDTPSLRFVRGTAPYFHDGRYATLEALLGDLSSPMGHTSSLPEGDRAAIAAYLRSL